MNYYFIFPIWLSNVTKIQHGKIAVDIIMININTTSKFILEVKYTNRGPKRLMFTFLVHTISYQGNINKETHEEMALKGPYQTLV